LFLCAEETFQNLIPNFSSTSHLNRADDGPLCFAKFLAEWLTGNDL